MKIYGNTLDYAHRSEKTVSDLLRRLDEDRISHLFSFGVINRNLSNTDHEADLILVGRAGVFLVEIKSGPIHIIEGQYYRGDIKLKSPILQAKQAWYDITEVLRSSKDASNEYMMGGYCCLYLDVAWSGGDRDADPLIMDREFLVNPVYELEKVVNARSEVAHKNGWRTTPYSLFEINAIKDVLVSNSYQANSVRLAIDETKDIYVNLGVEQAVVYSGISNNKRVRVVGPPGSGKTLLAYQTVKDNFRNGKSVLYICKNKALASMLNAKFIEEYGKQSSVIISTIDSFVYSKLLENNLLLSTSSQDRYEDKAKILCTFFGSHQMREEEKFDCVIIDEAQDVLETEYCDLINIVIKNGLEKGCWRLFIDPEQDIFNKYQKEIFDVYFNDDNSFEYILQKNYRNTIEIQRAAKAFSRHSYEITTDRNPVGDPPEILIYDNNSQNNSANVTNQAIRTLLCSGVKPSEITILSFVSRERSVAGKGKLKVPNGIQTAHISEKNWEYPEENKIYYASVYEYKGLDNDIIIYTDIDKLDEDERSRISHFVGATRAKAYYVMIMSTEAARKIINDNNKTPLGQFGEYVKTNGLSGYEKLAKSMSAKSDVGSDHSKTIEHLSDGQLQKLIQQQLRLGPMTRAEMVARTGLDSQRVMQHLSLNRNILYKQGSDLLWSIID